jgi:hypothetical protein
MDITNFVDNYLASSIIAIDPALELQQQQLMETTSAGTA